MSSSDSAGLSADAATLAGRRLRWLRIRAVARRHWYVLLRSPHRTFDLVLWPIVDVVLFGSLATFVSARAHDRPAAYLLAGIVLWHVVYQSQISLSTGLLEETWSRNLLNLMTTPMTEAEYVAGVALFGLAKTVAGVAVVALVALVLFGFGITSLGWVLLPLVAVLLVAGWVIALFVIGVVLRFGSGAEALAWGVLFAIMPLSGAFYPVGALPAVFRPVALALPTTHAFAAAQAVLDGRPLPWGEVGLAGACVIGAAAVVIWFCIRMLATFRRRGFMTRYT